MIILSSNVSFGNDVDRDSPVRLILAAEGLDCSALWCEYIRRFDPKNTLFNEDGALLTDNGKTLDYVHVEPGTSYSIPEGVTKVPIGAIDTYPSANIQLESLTIPSTIEEIEADAFRDAHIGKVNFTDWSAWCANVKLGNMYANPYWNSKPYAGGVLMTTFELKEGMTEIPDYIGYGLQFKNEINLPSTLRRIGAYTFYNNKELYSVILPAGLEEIGESAFEGCNLLENPSFPAGLKKIEDGAYRNCTKITEITLPVSLNYLGEMTDGIDTGESNPWKGIFQGCTSLEKAVIVADIDYIDDYLFHGCKSLQRIFLPLQLKTIGSHAFAGTTIDEITFPATLESIGDCAFSGVDESVYGGENKGSITNLIIPNGVTKLGVNAFAYQPITRLTIGSGLKIIPAGAFKYTNLEIVNFSEGLEQIIDGAFFGIRSSGISTINLPTTLTSIGSEAFGHTSIREMIIPDGVMNLPSGSCGCPSILTIGSGVKEISATAFSFDQLYTIRLKAHNPPTLSDAFPLTQAQNDQLTLIVNEKRHDYYTTNARWKQIDNIIEDGQSEVVIYMNGTYSLSTEIRLTSGLMPSSVTKMTVVGPLTANDLVIIKENMPALTSLDMSGVENVTSIPDNQFSGSLLTDIVLPDNLEVIGSSSFAHCPLLRLTQLPATVKSIGEYAFTGSTRVDFSTLPADLDSIGRYAFNGTGVQAIVANENLKQLGHGVFSNCKLLETVDLSASLLTDIPPDAFQGCHELDAVVLPETVESIRAQAFRCTAIRNIDFANGVKTIGTGAFSNNRHLVTASLPNSLQTVGDNLFADCPRLIAVSMPSTTTAVGTLIVNGDSKIANISCAAVKAPTAASGAFDGLRMRYVSLIIPTLSFQSYLDAPGWGKFQTIKNTILVQLGNGVSASVVSEKEYQNMLEEDALETAQDAAAVENSFATVMMTTRRDAERVKTLMYFASLFDGAQIHTGDDNSEMRVFINPEEGVEITSIMFNEEELLPYYLENNSVVLPKGGKGTLRILTEAVEVPSIILDQSEATVSEGDTIQLTATVTSHIDTTVTWSSSDESVATVDYDGLVTALQAGSATITATSSTGLTATCQVTVVDKASISGVNTDNIHVVSNNGVILVTAPEGTEASVYSISGQLIVVSTESRVEGLAPGAYIVRVCDKIFKVLVK